MTITPEQLSEFAEQAAKKAIHQFVKDDLGHCVLCNDKAYWTKHEKDHEFVDELIVTLKRMQEVKWGSLKNLASLLVVCFVAWVLLAAFGIKFP